MGRILDTAIRAGVLLVLNMKFRLRYGYEAQHPELWFLTGGMIFFDTNSKSIILQMIFSVGAGLNEF